MNSLLHIYAACLGKIRKVPHIDHVKHKQCFDFQKEVQKMARYPIHLEMQNFGTDAGTRDRMGLIITEVHSICS